MAPKVKTASGLAIFANLFPQVAQMNAIGRVAITAGQERGSVQEDLEGVVVDTVALRHEGEPASE